MNTPLTKVELTGVPETALWNLYQRASAARAGHLDDPRAVEVLARLDYPFERFDLPYRDLAARLHAQRVRTVDAALRRVLSGAPDATVVALGEGFEAGEVHRMLTAWARLLPGAWLLFDAVTANLQPVRRRNPLPDGYHPPDWTWTVDTDGLRELRELPCLTNLHEVPQAGGDRLLGVLRRVPGFKSQLPTFPVYQARLGTDAA